MDLVSESGRQTLPIDKVDTLGKLSETFQAIQAPFVDIPSAYATRPPSPPLWGTHLQVRRARDAAKWEAASPMREEFGDTSLTPSQSGSFSDYEPPSYFDTLKNESSNGRLISSDSEVRGDDEQGNDQDGDRGSKKRRRTREGNGISEEQGTSLGITQRTGGFFASKRSVVPSSAAIDSWEDMGEGADTRGGNGMISRLKHIQSHKSGMEWQQTQSEHSVQSSARHSSLPPNIGTGSVFNYPSSMAVHSCDSAQATCPAEELVIGVKARWVKANSEEIGKEDVESADESLGEGRTIAGACEVQIARSARRGESGDGSMTEHQGRFKTILNPEQLKIYTTAHAADPHPINPLVDSGRPSVTLLDYETQFHTTIQPLLKAYDAGSLSIQSIESLIRTLRSVIIYSSNFVHSLSRDHDEMTHRLISAAATDIAGLELSGARFKSRLDMSNRALQGANWVAQTHLADIEDLKRSSMALKTRKQAVEVELQAANSRVESFEMANARLEAEEVGWVKEREICQETNRILEMKVVKKDRKADTYADRWQRQEDAMAIELGMLQEECQENVAVALEANRILRNEMKLAKEGKAKADEKVEAGGKREAAIQASLDRARREYRDKTAWGMKKQIELVEKEADGRGTALGKIRTSSRSPS